MGLSCSCDDFDKGDHESWWEPGRRSVPPPGTCCCECDALLPAGETCQTILHGEVYDPGEIEPRPQHPDDVLDDEPDDVNLRRHWRQLYRAMEDAVDDYDGRHGWDGEYERFERYTSEYRCERCEGLADAIEDLGYCMIAPGELAAAHCEYVEQSGAPEMIWRRGRDGVLHPRRMTRWDFARREARRRISNARYFWFYGGWKSALRYKLWPAIERRTVSPVMRGLGYHRLYDHVAKRMRWTHGHDGDGMTWVRRQMVRDGFTVWGGEVRWRRREPLEWANPIGPREPV